MLAAARIIALEAARLASRWSRQIPPDVLRHVTATDSAATIKSDVGPAYPNEVIRVRHPVYGNRRVWVTNDYRPFLAPAAQAKADAAAAEIAKSIDDICHELGFKGAG